MPGGHAAGRHGTNGTEITAGSPNRVARFGILAMALTREGNSNLRMGEKGGNKMKRSR